MTIESKAIHVAPNKTRERHRFSRRVATKKEHFLTGREKVLWRPGQAPAPGFLCALPCPRPLARDRHRTVFHPALHHGEDFKVDCHCCGLCKYLQHGMEAAQGGLHTGFRQGRSKAPHLKAPLFCMFYWSEHDFSRNPFWNFRVFILQL